MNHQSSSSSQHCSQQGEDAGSVSQKEQEETDTSSRPRLTSEQTSVLEKHFQKESKPVTEVKKRLAQQVGLPLDKVNVSICVCGGLLLGDTIIDCPYRIGTRTDEPKQNISRS